MDLLAFIQPCYKPLRLLPEEPVPDTPSFCNVCHTCIMRLSILLGAQKGFPVLNIIHPVSSFIHWVFEPRIANRHIVSGLKTRAIHKASQVHRLHVSRLYAGVFNLILQDGKLDLTWVIKQHRRGEIYSVSLYSCIRPIFSLSSYSFVRAAIIFSNRV